MCCCKDEGCTHTHTQDERAGMGTDSEDSRTVGQLTSLKREKGGKRQKPKTDKHKKRKPNKAIEQSGSLSRTCRKTDERMSRQTNGREREQERRQAGEGAKYIKLKTYLHLLLGFASVSQGAASKRRSGGKLKQVDK